MSSVSHETDRFAGPMFLRALAPALISSVGLGVAEYVTSPTNVTAQDILPVEGTGHLDPEQLGELTNAQLKEMAEAMGIDTKKLTTKAKLIEAITEANVIQGPAEDDGEQAPTFDATEAVQ